MKNKVLLSSILVIYILLPILILFNNYLYNIKFYLLIGIGLIIFLLMKLFKVSLKELGITKNNLLKSIKRNFILISSGSSAKEIFPITNKNTNKK